MKNKLFVFMIDALCEFDVSYMRTLPNFGSILERGALVEEMLPVYPSFTYPCHVSIMTGCYPDRHGIPHNEMVQAGVHPVPWYTKREMVKKKFFAEYAKEAGYTTCLINWPVSAGADVDLNLPMIVPMGYHGDNPRQYYEGVSTPELLDRYFWKYGHLLRGLNKPINGSLDMFTNAVAPDIIRDYHQPDVMFVKMCTQRSTVHDLGVDTDFAREQLKKHDCELGVLMESIRRYGDFEHTNFVIMGDHGQTDVKRVLNFNRVLQEAGLQTLNTDGTLGAWDAYCHSTGISGWIEARDPNDKALLDRIHRALLDARESGKYDLKHVFTKEEARARYPPRRPLLLHRRVRSAGGLQLCPRRSVVHGRAPGRLQDGHGLSWRPSHPRSPHDVFLRRPRRQNPGRPSTAPASSTKRPPWRACSVSTCPMWTAGR